MQHTEIAVVPTTCPTCGDAGSVAYRNVTDRVLGNPGAWNVFRCSRSECSMFFLNPRPADTDIYKLYANYPTHDMVLDPHKKYVGSSHTILGKIRHAYLARRFGYTSYAVRWGSWMGYLAYLHPYWKNMLDTLVMHTSYVPQGKFLDVGCGGGGALALMRSHGFKVTGTDFDSVVIDRVKRAGYDARVGSLESQNFTDNTYDAALMSHVIEHVPYPQATLVELYRVLKPGGQCVLYTPNSMSLASILFAHAWRGLEVPDHLHVFTPRALEALLRNAGFTEVHVTTTTAGSGYVWNESVRVARINAADDTPVFTSRVWQYVRPAIYFFYGWIIRACTKRGEVIVCVCRK